MSDVGVDELHESMAKLADKTDAPHGLPVPCTVEMRRPILLSYAMRDYEEGVQYIQNKLAEPLPPTVHVCKNSDMNNFEWEVNGWPTSGYVSIMALYEYDGDENGVPRNTKLRPIRRWIFRRNLTNERIAMLIDSWGLRYGAVSVEAEIAAQAYLLKRLTEKQRRSYILGGNFVEESKRSGCAYLLRKGLPTLAFGRENKLLCALCLHSFGAFSKSFVGLMPPSDEVLAHLLLIRGDEARFWKKSGQHPAWDPMSGI
jgi:hypothetical protein